MVLLLVGIAGLLARLVVAPNVPAGAVAYRSGGDTGRPGKDSVAAQAVRLNRPLQAGERIDVDGASAPDLTRLPRIGPGLATRIVADREERGPFGSLEELTRVSGVGPVVIEAIRPYAAFTQRVQSRPPAATGRIHVNHASEEELATLPGIGPARAKAIIRYREQHGPFRDLDDLDEVAGIGPGTLARIAPRVVIP